MNLLSKRQLVALDCLPQEELDEVLLQKASRILGYELSASDGVAYLTEVDAAGVYTSYCPDRLILTALSTLFGVPEDQGEVRYITHRRYAVAHAADREGEKLVGAGFEPEIDFGFREGVVAAYPHVLCWRVTKDNVRRIMEGNVKFAPTLAGTLASYIPVVDKLSREELRAVLREAVLDTTPLVTGLRIIKNAQETNTKKLRTYAVNLYLLGSKLGEAGGTLMNRKSWGSEIALNRVNIDTPVSYMAYTGLAPLYPSSDVEQPTDNNDQQQDYLDTMVNNRTVKKYKRRLGDEPGK